MLYVEFWDNERRKWSLARMIFWKALICHWFGEDCRIVPRREIIFEQREVVAMKNYKCEECIHFIPETVDDVACCNCCENSEFFEEYKDEYTLADLGNNWW